MIFEANMLVHLSFTVGVDQSGHIHAHKSDLLVREKRTSIASRSPRPHRHHPSSPPTNERLCRWQRILVRFLPGASLQVKVPRSAQSVIRNNHFVPAIWNGAELPPSLFCMIGKTSGLCGLFMANLQRGSPRTRRLLPARGASVVVAVG